MADKQKVLECSIGKEDLTIKLKKFIDCIHSCTVWVRNNNGKCGKTVLGPENFQFSESGEISSSLYDLPVMQMIVEGEHFLMLMARNGKDYEEEEHPFFISTFQAVKLNMKYAPKPPLKPQPPSEPVLLSPEETMPPATLVVSEKTTLLTKEKITISLLARMRETTRRGLDRLPFMGKTRKNKLSAPTIEVVRHDGAVGFTLRTSQDVNGFEIEIANKSKKAQWPKSRHTVEKGVRELTIYLQNLKPDETIDIRPADYIVKASVFNGDAELDSKIERGEFSLSPDEVTFILEYLTGEEKPAATPAPASPAPEGSAAAATETAPKAAPADEAETPHIPAHPPVDLGEELDKGAKQKEGSGESAMIAPNPPAPKPETAMPPAQEISVTKGGWYRFVAPQPTNWCKAVIYKGEDLVSYKEGPIYRTAPRKNRGGRLSNVIEGRLEAQDCLGGGIWVTPDDVLRYEITLSSKDGIESEPASAEFQLSEASIARLGLEEQQEEIQGTETQENPTKKGQQVSDTPKQPDPAPKTDSPASSERKPAVLPPAAHAPSPRTAPQQEASEKKELTEIEKILERAEKRFSAPDSPIRKDIGTLGKVVEANTTGIVGKIDETQGQISEKHKEVMSKLETAGSNSGRTEIVRESSGFMAIVLKGIVLGLLVFFLCYLLNQIEWKQHIVVSEAVLPEGPSKDATVDRPKARIHKEQAQIVIQPPQVMVIDSPSSWSSEPVDQPSKLADASAPQSGSKNLIPCMATVVEGQSQTVVSSQQASEACYEPVRYSSAPYDTGYCYSQPIVRARATIRIGGGSYCPPAYCPPSQPCGPVGYYWQPGTQCSDSARGSAAFRAATGQSRHGRRF